MYDNALELRLSEAGDDELVLSLGRTAKCAGRPDGALIVYVIDHVRAECVNRELVCPVTPTDAAHGEARGALT
jgi:hypothetical protein